MHIDRDTLTFLALCVAIVVAVLGVYSYDERSYRTEPSMVVVPVESTSDGGGVEYVVSKVETSTPSDASEYGTATTDTLPTTTDGTTTTCTTSDTTSTSASRATAAKATSTSLVVHFPIPLNSATLEELVCIKGIGEVTAQKVIDYRNSIGGYTSRYQLLEVNGIGQAKMETIMQYTYIEDEDLSYGQDAAQPEAQAEYQGDYQAESPQTVPAEEPYVEPQPTVEYPIDLNSATLEELTSIPGVDGELAQRVLDLRDTLQYFSDVHELLYVDGVSESLLDGIMEYVCVTDGAVE